MERRCKDIDGLAAILDLALMSMMINDQHDYKQIVSMTEQGVGESSKEQLA